MIDPLLDKAVELASLPIKVLVKFSKATVTIHDGAQLIAAASDGLDPSVGVVGVYATSVADASGVAISRLFSVGYALASGDLDDHRRRARA